MKQLFPFSLLMFTLVYMPSARGEMIAALTLTNDLVRFDSATPNITTATPISGLIAGDTFVGMDLRPANNLLYGVASDSGVGGANTGVGRIYTIDPFTGVANLISTLAADPADSTAPFPYSALSGSFFGVDFNPVADRLRIVSDTGQNLRVNVATGLTQLDGPLAYAAGDANAGSPPMVVASAYSNNTAGAVSTILFQIDAALSIVDLQLPANDGTLYTVSQLSSTAFADAAFDISGQTDVAYVVLDGITLATLNIISGQVTEVGPIDTIGSIHGLAVLPAVPEPFAVSLALIGAAMVVMQRPRRRATK